MKLDPPPTLAPPWRSVFAWQSANTCLDYHLNRHYQDLYPATQISRNIRNRLESIFDALDELGRITCTRCPEICCLSASPWYDLRDLVYLHLNQLPIPLSQTISGIRETCCYISDRGCTLPRIIRPWICTWYLCPTQTACTRKSNDGRPQTLSRTLEEVKTLRKDLEDEFIRVVTSKLPP